MILGPKFSLKISAPRSRFLENWAVQKYFGPTRRPVVEQHVHVLRVLHLLKRFQYSYGPNSTILCSLAEYKESDSTACLAVASLKGRVTSDCVYKCLAKVAGIKTAILAEHTTSAFTGHKTGLGGSSFGCQRWTGRSIFSRQNRTHRFAFLPVRFSPGPLFT